MNTVRQQSNLVAELWSCIALGTFSLVLSSSGLLAGGKAATANDSATSPARDSKPNFDKVGPQAGDQLPELNLRTIQGEVQRLSDAWRGGPALLVTSSLTCPKSRSRWPEVQAIADKYGDKLNVVIIYVVEAHPVGSVCPYKGVEDITPENHRDGILRRQPTTLSQRIELAQEFKRYLRINLPIYIDNKKNQAWKALGAAPNLALLVDKEGIVQARQGWFEGADIDKKIDEHLAADEASKSKQRRPSGTETETDPNAEILTKVGLDDSEISDAVFDKTGEKLKAILRRAPDVVKYVMHGERIGTRTMLMEAVALRNLAAAKLLLTHGADVSARTSSFGSALQIAAEHGDLEITKLLLQHRADPNVPATGKTPLHEAATGGHTEVAMLLARAGAKADLYSDIALGNIDAVQKRLAADPSLVFRPDGEGRMPLDYAAANGQIDAAKLLIARGAPMVDDRLTRREPPLHRAIRRKDTVMIKLLLDAGSSASTAVGRRGESAESRPALHLAVSSSDVRIVKLLLDRGADVSARDTHSQTALHDAATLGNAEIAKLLLEAGADINAPQLGFSLPCGSSDDSIPTRNTPLHFAAASGNPETINILVNNGAKIDARNRFGQTPLLATIARQRYAGLPKPRLDNIKALLAAGSDINVTDEEGRTILDLATAAMKADQEGEQQDTLRDVVGLLKEHGAKPGTRKANSRTSLVR